MINVSKTYLPPLEDYLEYLKKIWDSNWLTNHGPLVSELEDKLKQYLGVKHLFFVSNGTIALQIAIKALELKGEIITTPFSYVATTSTIVWEGCKPVFVDINPDTLTIDPHKIEPAITINTTAILATHVFGIPCDITSIADIARKHNLKVIFDNAHGFGVKHNNNSLASYGNISTLSFHATKLFHTTEGGAVVTNDDELAHKISYMRNFGHNGQETFWGLGINGKNSEFHAAMGLCIFPKVPQIIEDRKRVHNLYSKLLLKDNITRPFISESIIYNYAYYPILLDSEDQLLKIKNALNKQNIFPRRYFYPSLNTLNYVDNKAMPIAEYTASRILCLPIFYDLSDSAIQEICDIINSQ